ncbi:MAG TPA: hypothetical protein VJV79_30780, partial [Polyangiaceae bacterium]|nr:hypothetical protein [Polyangiaceae bacterium]
QGLSLRLYDPQSRQWSLNYANAADGHMAVPTVGQFRDGRGEFYDQEVLNGRAVFVRFVISGITSNSAHFEQAFSDDGGKTWEVNWIADSRHAFHHVRRWPAVLVLASARWERALQLIAAASGARHLKGSFFGAVYDEIHAASCLQISLQLVELRLMHRALS